MHHCRVTMFYRSKQYKGRNGLMNHFEYEYQRFAKESVWSILLRIQTEVQERAEVKWSEYCASSLCALRKKARGVSCCFDGNRYQITADWTPSATWSEGAERYACRSASSTSILKPTPRLCISTLGIATQKRILAGTIHIGQKAKQALLEYLSLSACTLHHGAPLWELHYWYQQQLVFRGETTFRFRIDRLRTQPGNYLW